MSEPGEPGRWPLLPRLRYPLIQEVVASPDGQRVVYAVREPLLTDEESTFLTHLFLATLDGGQPPRQLTFGDAANSGAQWSPDGRYLAFLSKRSGKNNIHVMPVDGGEAWALTKYDQTDVAALRWAPDGNRIAFRMPEPPTEGKEKARKAKDDAKSFGVDYDFAHLFTLPFAVAPHLLPDVLQVTSGRFQVVDFDWSPDGTTLAFTYQPTPDADTWTQMRLATVPSDGRAQAAHDLATVASGGLRPAFSPDGRWIACDTGEEPPRWGGASRVVLYPVGEPGALPRPLATTPDGETSLLGWAPDGQAVHVLDTAGVSTQLYALPVSGTAAVPMGDRSLLKTPATSNGRGQIALVGQDFQHPQAVYLLDSASGQLHQVAQPPLPDDWPQAPLPAAEVIRWPSFDGREIEGIIIYPLDYEAGRRYPLIVHAHGGPAGVFTSGYLGAPGGQVDAAGLAERGYAILRPNPRGSGGYGREFRFANYGNWGGGDYRDVVAGVEHLIEQGLADPERLGIAGWSYGGFMSSWVITQTPRFKAACIGAPVTHPLSFNGTSDIPGFIPDYFGAEYWENPDAYLRQSPMLHVKGVTTPTLIQHGETDIRVPLSQGRELYNALKRQGVPVELVIYPREGHGISEPRHVLDVARRATAWIERWIPGGPR